ncbi:MAG: hypothetical protein QXV73_03925 [Candidatus Micrarchaeia archaeon]
MEDEKLLLMRGECKSNREDRVRVYNELKRIVLGNDKNNPLYSHLEIVTSLCYYPDNIIFDIDLKESKVSDEVLEQRKLLVKDMHEYYFRSGLDIKFYDWIMNGLLYGDYFCKVFIDGNKVKVKPVSPKFISVLNEEHEDLDEYQAICHTVYLPRRYAEKKYAGRTFVVASEDTSDVDVRYRFLMKVDNQNASVTEMPLDVSELRIMPRRYTDVVEVDELWYYDYDKKDWVMVQFIGDEIVERATASQCFLKGILPFVHFKPRNIEGQFYGMSELFYLIRLFEKLDEYYERLDHLVDLLIQPPLIVGGLTNSIEAEEIKKKINIPASVIEILDPTSKIDLYTPKITPDILALILNKYEEVFKSRSGLEGILRGSPMPNVRSANYAQILAQFASAPLKKLALKSECFIEDVMTLYITAKSLVDSRFSALLGNEMQADIFAHTSSPITAMAYEDRILTLAEMGIIPLENVIDLLPIPKKEEIVRRVKEIEALKIQEAMMPNKQEKGGKK